MTPRPRESKTLAHARVDAGSGDALNFLTLCHTSCLVKLCNRFQPLPQSVTGFQGFAVRVSYAVMMVCSEASVAVQCSTVVRTREPARDAQGHESGADDKQSNATAEAPTEATPVVAGHQE